MKLNLRILEGYNAGLVIPLVDRSILMGRATTMGETAPGYLFFYEPTVSRQHAELVWDAKIKAFWIHQRSQTNQTLVNQVAVEPGKPKKLQVGSTIQMGKLKLVLQLGN
jgi:pSer/pThr/pTyr-binding forkhead associated (FHA) protein